MPLFLLSLTSCSSAAQLWVFTLCIINQTRSIEQLRKQVLGCSLGAQEVFAISWQRELKAIRSDTTGSKTIACRCSDK